MSRMNKMLLTTVLFFPLLTEATEKRCLNTTPTSPLMTYLSVNIEGYQSATDLNKLLEPKKGAADAPTILVRAQSDANDVQFQTYTLQEGDCLLANPIEQRELYVAQDTRLRQNEGETWFDAVVRFARELTVIHGSKKRVLLQPIVLFRKNDDAKHFGYLAAVDYQALSVDPSYAETSTDEILNHKGPHNDLTVIYVICPRDRDEVCELTIKSKGRWVMEGDKKLKLSVLARSLRSESPTSYRITSKGDTPQGIYFIWASMYTSALVYGSVSRIDIESAELPINARAYNQNSYLMDELVPQKALNDYWLNEYPLAYKLGRISLRIHNDTLDPALPSTYTTPVTKLNFRPTAGCINTGQNMRKLLDVLISLDVFNKSDIDLGLNSDPQSLGWRAARGLGKAFLVVKDL